MALSRSERSRRRRYLVDLDPGIDLDLDPDDVLAELRGPYPTHSIGADVGHLPVPEPGLPRMDPVAVFPA